MQPSKICNWKWHRNVETCCVKWYCCFFFLKLTVVIQLLSRPFRICFRFVSRKMKLVPPLMCMLIHLSLLPCRGKFYKEAKLLFVLICNSLRVYMWNYQAWFQPMSLCWVRAQDKLCLHIQSPSLLILNKSSCLFTDPFAFNLSTCPF